MIKFKNKRSDKFLKFVDKPANSKPNITGIIMVRD